MLKKRESENVMLLLVKHCGDSPSSSELNFRLICEIIPDKYLFAIAN